MTHMILSFRSREKMSYARSPLPVCSTTIGTRPRFLFWTFIWKSEDYSMTPERIIMLHTLWLNKRFVICLNISLNHGRKQIRKNNKSCKNESRRISCSRVSLYGNYSNWKPFQVQRTFLIFFYAQDHTKTGYEDIIY